MTSRRTRVDALAAPSPATSSLYTADFWTASASHFLLGMGFWMFVLFPLHLSALGAGDAWIGVVLALEPAAAVLVRPALGGVLANRGRVWTLRAAGLANVAAVASYLLVHDLGLPMMLVRVLHGVGVGALFTTFFTYAADIAPVDRRTEALAVFGISGMLPTAFAPSAGEELVRRFGFQGLFAAAVALSLVSLALSWRLAEIGGVSGAPGRGFWRLGVEPRLARVWSTTLLFSLAMSSYLAFLAPYGRALGLDRVGPFFFFYSVAAVLLRIVGRRIPDRLGPRRTLVPALASLGAGLCLLSRLDSPAKLAAAGLLCGLGHGYLFPILAGLAVEGADRHGRGDALSFYTAVFDTGQVLGPPLFGAIAEAAGYPPAFAIACAAILAVLLLWLPMLRR